MTKKTYELFMKLHIQKRQKLRSTGNLTKIIESVKRNDLKALKINRIIYSFCYLNKKESCFFPKQTKNHKN